ncbi:hypothetical protein [Micropruina sp.]|uniref:hypothetical protein n=1 Tax=Micropruina sp. TaxID=2737536 RepID=UPI0039E324C1
MPWLFGSLHARRVAVLAPSLVVVAALLTVAGCVAEDPDPEPSTIGSQAQLCSDRVDAGQAAAVIAQPLTALHELNTFTNTHRAGECALVGVDGGAMLSVVVVHDPKGTALSSELEELSQQENYSGTDRSGVTGEGTITTALVAIDDTYYVRVMGLGGSSTEQRTAALTLAESVASRTEPIK